jgi:hypothetical protein
MRHPPCFAERAWYLYENHCVPLARVSGAAAAEVLWIQKSKETLTAGSCAPGISLLNIHKVYLQDFLRARIDNNRNKQNPVILSESEEKTPGCRGIPVFFRDYYF